MRVVVDTGVLLAAADDDDHHHDAAVVALVANRGRLVVPGPVITETAWMIEATLGPTAEARFVASMGAGDVQVVDLDAGDYQRCAELISRYADLGVGLVDASVVAIAERLRITTIATINHRDFRVVRPTHCDAFDLIP